MWYNPAIPHSCLLGFACGDVGPSDFRADATSYEWGFNVECGIVTRYRLRSGVGPMDFSTDATSYECGIVARYSLKNQRWADGLWAFVTLIGELLGNF